MKVSQNFFSLIVGALVYVLTAIFIHVNKILPLVSSFVSSETVMEITVSSFESLLKSCKPSIDSNLLLLVPPHQVVFINNYTWPAHMAGVVQCSMKLLGWCAG